MIATARRHAGSKRLIAMVMVLGALTLLLVGCKTQQTNMKLKKANDLLGQAEAVEAQKYAEDLLQAARQQVSSANSSLAGGDAATALNSANQAVSLAEQALEKSRQQYATDIGEEAKKAVETARLNQGETEDAQRFQNILNQYSQIAQMRSDGKWKDMIDTSRRIIEEVDILLQRLKNESERTLVDAQNQLKSLKAEGGQQYAPERVIEVTDLVNQVELFIHEKFDYINARNQAELAIQKAREGIDATKREKSKEQIALIETLIVDAIEEGAELYALSQLRDVNQLYDSLTADFHENRFDKVLLTADTLKPKAEYLVFQTKRLAAEARIQRILSSIADLTEAGVREYLPGRIETLEQMLERSRSLFQRNNVEAFDEIKQISQEALTEETKIRNAFNDLAQEEIRLTGDRLDRTQTVFDRMQDVFIVQPRPGLSPLEIQFENAKEALRTELGAGLRISAHNLEVASLRQREGRYRGAIELAKSVAEQADTILDEIYHVVAFNAITELAASISRYEMDGAREYAEAELRRTKTLLEETKQMLGVRQFRPAVAKAADARAQMELMVQRIAERGSVAIEEAKQAADRARSAETERYRRDDLNAALQLIEAAHNAMRAEQLKNAVELAEQATERAQTAAREAMRLAAEDELENARARITRAQDAGAALYAAKEFDDAQRLRQSAERHFVQGDYEVARDVAVTASERADRSFYRLVDTADASINEAKSAGGWDTDRPVLAAAIARNDDARRLIETGAYEQSAEAAHRANAEALKVAVGAKRQNYEDHVKRIRQNLEQGRSQGITMFQVDDAITVNRRLVELQDQFDRRNLTNYEYTMNELKRIESRLRNTLDTTGLLVAEVIEGQREHLTELETGGAAAYAAPLITDARANLRFAEIDFRNDLYKSAHAHLSQAIAQVREIQRRQNQEQYIATAQELFTDLFEAEHRFSSVLTRGPEQMKSFAQGEHGMGQSVSIASVYTPNRFRAEVEKIYSRALQITPPSEEVKTHREVVATLTDMRLAALSFEKMIIFNRMTQAEANQLIDEAFRYLESAHTRISNLQRQFTESEKMYLQTEMTAGLVLGR